MVFENLLTLRERTLLDHLVDSLVLHAGDTQDASSGQRVAAFSRSSLRKAQPQLLIWMRVLFFIEEKLFFFLQVIYIRLHIQLEFFFISIGPFCMFTEIQSCILFFG